MRIRGIYRLFEARGEGGPTVTVHLPAQLAQDLLKVLHEAVEVAGMEPSDEMGEPEGEDDEAELDAAEDDLDADVGPSDDDMALFGMGLGDDDEGDEDERAAGEEDDDESGSDDDDEQEQDEAMMGEKHIGFKKLSGQLAHRKGVRNPDALAASIGMKKYGTKNLRKVKPR